MQTGNVELLYSLTWTYQPIRKYNKQNCSQSKLLQSPTNNLHICANTPCLTQTYGNVVCDFYSSIPNAQVFETSAKFSHRNYATISEHYYSFLILLRICDLAKSYFQKFFNRFLSQNRFCNTN
jgi:hypothetical protein